MNEKKKSLTRLSTEELSGITGGQVQTKRQAKGAKDLFKIIAGLLHIDK